MISTPAAGASLRWLLVLAVSLAASVLAKSNDDGIKYPDYVSRTHFDHALTPFYFFDDSEIVMIFERMRGTPWRSVNAGAEWTKVKDIQAEDVNQDMPITRCPTDNSVAIVFGRRKTHWYTRDKGETWRDFSLDDHPATHRGNPISFHADDSKKIIINTGLGRHSKKHAAYYTLDGFKTEPKLLREGAVQCIWARERAQMNTGSEDADADRILCIVDGEMDPPRTSDQRLLWSDDYFEKAVEPHVENNRPERGFLSMVSATKFIYAARQARDSSEMALHVTTDGRTWHRALFGKQKLDADGYTVMEGTNYSARVDVMQGGGIRRASPMGALFSSNSNGTYFVKMEGYTNRNQLGLVDYEGVDGIQGVAIANVVDNPEDALEDVTKVVKSQITFNDGRKWQDLSAVKGGRDPEQLHLHSFSEMRNQGKVFSNKGAPGLIMGVGNVGDELAPYEEGDLWISTDGGLTFTGHLPGAHKYEFGDSGAMLCAIYDEDRTDEVMWSSNFGQHWEGFKLIESGEDKIRAGILTTIPDSTSSKFLLQASTGTGERIKHWVFSIDLSYWVAEREMPKCKGSDFETWHARQDEDGKPGCIMGHTQSFTRRKPDAECYVEKEFEEALPETKDCDCVEEDFECDADYIRAGKDRESCQPLKAQRPRGTCEDPEGTYTGSSGFRKIPGNTCKDNDVSKKMLKDVERSCKDAKDSPPESDGKIYSRQTDFEVSRFGDYRYLPRPDTVRAEDSEEVILMITYEDRRLYSSRDGGKEWSPVRELEDVEVTGIFANPYELNDAYLTTASKKIFYTDDRGETFKSFEAPAFPNPDAAGPVLHFHEKERRWLIFAGCSSVIRPGQACPTKAYITTKRGASWDVLMENAGDCEFVWQKGRDVSEKLTYCSEEKKLGRSLVSSEDWFQETNVLFEDIVNYATMDEFIVVATRDVADPENLMLNSSIDGTNFASARFPPRMNVTHNGYTVLDSSSHSIFAHATVNGRFEQEYGNIIKSNSNGTNFVMSLEHVNRNRRGYVDFEKLLSFEGSALANVVRNVEEVESGKKKQKQTKITHNDGADWTYLQVPRDEHGKPDKCDTMRPPCALHLHGYTERKKPEESYSSPSATGLVIGVGNKGEYLGDYGKGDTYISRDGGVEWDLAQKGQYLWEFGDQGSIIVLAPHESPTQTIKWSTDEGRTFHDFTFTDGETEVSISDLTTIPSDSSMMFLIWAHRTDLRGQAVTFNLDFSGLFDGQCKINDENPDESDYYSWTPRHPNSDDDCLFGHEIKYPRKKASSEKCYNGGNVQRNKEKVRNCACNKRDFEWFVKTIQSESRTGDTDADDSDYNFVRGSDGLCKLVGDIPDPAAVCEDKNVIEYYDTIGYRRIPGDTCEGGDELDKVGDIHACPDREEEFNKKHGTSGVVIFFAVVLSVGAAAALGYFVWTRYGGQFGRIQLGDGLSSGGFGSRRSFDPSSPWLRYPVMAVSAVAAAAMAVPMVAISAYRWLADKVGGRRRGYTGIPRTYTSRRSFARGRGDFAAVGASDESDLLGEDSDEEA